MMLATLARLKRVTKIPGLVSQLVNHQQRRYLDLQEYQSKQILYEHGIQVQKFKVISNEREAEDILFPELKQQQEKLTEGGESKQLSRWSGFKEDISNSDEFVIKAQILAGGRGKGRFLNSSMTGGGVQLTKDRKVALKIAQQMLNDRLVTKQTTNDGVLVEKVMIAEAVRLKREFYLAIVLDRSYEAGPILVTSYMGGMDIEEVAAQSDDTIKKFTIPLDLELDLDTVKRIVFMAFNLNLQESDLIEQCAQEIIKLHKMFLKLDATQIEINPLGVTDQKQVICVDAKIKFDENAKFRQTWLDELEQMNINETDTRDFEARKHNLNFIGLEGSIGCLVNGAGLAMATMDIIKLHGGEPANFLDVGGGASVEQVREALKIIISDTNVKSIFVNIFGGIMRCDTVAKGIIEATKSLQLKVPIVVRLEGTRVNEAKELIENSQLNIVSCDDFDEAAKSVIQLSSR